MTATVDPTIDPVVALVRGIVDQAPRLGLTWSRKTATVFDGTNPAQVTGICDGDTTRVPMVSMIGPILRGARVFVDAVPPSGLYITGYAGTPVGRDVVAYGSRPSSSTATGAEIGVLRLDSVDLVAGYEYLLVTSTLLMHSTVATDAAGVRIRSEVGGVTATTSSPSLVSTIEQITAAGGNASTQISLLLRPTVDEVRSFLLTNFRGAGTGSINITQSSVAPINMTVYNLGLAVTDTGVAV